ncbi:MAG: glycosyltransferase [Chloroflexi bacterium]|nr:glycosyltransferase [Chloroflexota bacterium]
MSQSANMPIVSVIVPTYNRKDSLRAVLAALEMQIYPLDRLEVIVIDDGSSDGTAEIADEKFEINLRYIRQTNQGAAVARNRGANEANGAILFFLDDDIAVVPEFISAIVEAHQQHDRLIAIGNLQPVTHRAQTVFERIQGVDTATPPNPGTAPILAVNFADCLTGMFSVKRHHFFQIGMLLDLAGDGRVAWGDVDFGYRAHRLGFQFVRCYKAVGYHDDYSIRDMNTCARRWQRTSQTAVKLIVKYPEVQPYLPMFRDKAPISWGHDAPTLIVRKIIRGVASTKAVLWALEKIAALLERYYPSVALLRPIYRWILGGYMFKGYRQGLQQYGPLKAA